MTTATRPAMSKKRGTIHLRSRQDLAEMVSWVARVKGMTISAYLDPLLRPQVTADYARYLPLIEELKRQAEESAGEVSEQEENEAD